MGDILLDTTIHAVSLAYIATPVSPIEADRKM